MNEDEIDPDPKFCISGNLISNGVPVRYSSAEAKTKNKSFSPDHIQQDGSFRFCVPEGDSVFLIFYDLCGDTLKTIDIPSSANSGILGEIEIEKLSENVNLELFNCLGNPVNNGHVFYKGQSFNITEGSVQLIHCRDDLYSEVFVHNSDSMKTETIVLNPDQETYSNRICQDVDQFAVYKQRYLPTSFVFDTIQVLKYTIVEGSHKIFINIGESSPFFTGAETYPLQTIEYTINDESFLPFDTIIQIHPFKIEMTDINGNPTIGYYSHSIFDYSLQITDLIKNGDRIRMKGHATSRFLNKNPQDSIIFDIVTSD